MMLAEPVSTGFSDEELAAVLLKQESSLLDPAVRRDCDRVRELLAEDFVEFGSSGRIWTREQIIDSLASESHSPLALEDFRCRAIAPRVALVTYRSVRTDAETGTRAASNRSSIWIENEGRWRIRFHQGTPAS